MMYENDKLNIPDEYRKMSVSELRREKEKIYQEIIKAPNDTTKKSEHCNGATRFNF